MSYYRFSGYLWWFYEPDQWEKVRTGTTLQDILNLYAFDATLRSHIMRLAHSIEVWLRASFTNHVAERHGPMGYLNPAIHVSPTSFEKDRSKLDAMLGTDSTERFVVAFTQKYSDPRPPVWMACELMSIGLLSKWYDNLKEASLRKAIASEAGLNHHVLSSFLRMFTVLRNGAAHHSRVWNRQTPLRGVTVKSPPKLLETALDGADESRIHYVLAIAAYIVQRVDPTSRTVASLRDHLLTAEDEWLEEMDFPFNFENDPLWNSAPKAFANL
ncbi:MAG: Abi family protein [Ancrocorticia sp.]|uniref:Abi family protein n=1 Tax=Ancrocorticia sp. TaxID=2593684 RepID=UPI003F8DBED4